MLLRGLKSPFAITLLRHSKKLAFVAIFSARAKLAKELLEKITVYRCELYFSMDDYRYELMTVRRLLFKG